MAEEKKKPKTLDQFIAEVQFQLLRDLQQNFKALAITWVFIMVVFFGVLIAAIFF